jgi:hypothetical protein
MSEHEFYADPTLFDHWQSSAGHWLRARGEKICPYLWVIAFAVAGVALMSVSLVLLGISVHDTAAHLRPAWNQSLAQGITAVIALASAQSLFRQALSAWPEDITLPRQLREAGRYVGWRPVAKPQPAKITPVRERRASTRPVRSAAEHEAVQAFFAGVRAAGVNVAIAKALFAAGIRSPRQLLKASDRQLAAIRGVGPATVHKLRVQFGKQA